MIIDAEKTAALIAGIAEEEIAPRYGKLAKGDVRQKSGPSDLVTEVDEAMEARLRTALKDVHPGAGFIGEELAAKDPGSVDALKGDGAFWIVDPLDGTRNFVNGVDQFGVIVAYVENGETRQGWIYAVPEKASAVAEAGGGAFWKGERIRPKPQCGGKPVALRSLGWLRPESRQSELRTRLAARFDSRPGHCSAYAYLDIALGRVDLKVSSRLHPWDHAAGALLVTEAGGKVAYLDDELDYAPAPTVDAALLAVAPGRDWRGFADAICD